MERKTPWGHARSACVVGIRIPVPRAGARHFLAATVKVYPAPQGEELSTDYTVQVEGQDTPVYVAKVSPADQKARWKGMDDKKNSADFFEKASFAYFDFEGTVRIQITCPEAVRSAKVLPSSYGIQPSVNGKTISIQLDKPRHLTVEINDTWVGACTCSGIRRRPTCLVRTTPTSFTSAPASTKSAV